MATETPSASADLVKKLLFPSYTDAGANDAFDQQKHNHNSQEQKLDDKGSNGIAALAEDHAALAIRKVPSTASSQMSNDSAVSTDAPTEIQNNLTYNTRASKRIPVSPRLPRSTERTKSFPPPPSVSAQKRKPAPSFFATTRPVAVTKSVSTGGESASDEAFLIESPPKLPRRPMPSERSSSTVAVTGSTLFSSDGSIHEESTNDTDAEHVSTKVSPNNELGQNEEHQIAPTSPKPSATEPQRLETISPKWEEEARPDQTAFGKELLFRRSLSPNSSDVMSTASEMGTVIGPSQLEDLDAEVEAAATAIENGEQPLTATTPLDHHYDNDGAWDKDGLSLPLLEQKEEEKKGTDEMSSAANNMLKLAIRRIGSGITSRNGTSNNATSRQSISAPSTPRQTVSASTGSQQMPSSPVTSGVNNPPNSFLLRSPGSAAHFAAKSRKYFLSPRQRYDREKQNNNKVERIPEDGTFDGKISIGSIPFQIARSCLSFDAYDTSMDQHVEYKMNPELAFSIDQDRYRFENPQRMPIRYQRRSPDRGIRASASWDVSSQSMFRPAGFVRNQQEESSSNSQIHRSKSMDSRNRSYNTNNKGNRVRIMSDFSPRANPDTSIQLSTPQRLNTARENTKQIEIEREDAIDILACLVERGVSFSTKFDDGIQTQVDELKKSVDSPEQGSNRHNDLLDDLAKSHEFAVEIQRASQSASTWLKSIGRSQSNELDGESKQSDKENDVMDFATTKAKLHAMESDLLERSELADRLNEELAQCRAEIGRLRSNSTAIPFRSPNRSILDQSDDVSIAENQASSTDDDFHPDKTDDYLNQDSALFLIEPVGSPVHIGDSAELCRYKEALKEANKRIEVLYSDLKTDSKDDEETESVAPIVHVEKSPKAPSPKTSNQDEGQLLNASMLDQANFVTEWDDLSSPLPPPPDHGLRSPIVAAVLREWSDDDALHESLITWIDSVLAGMDPASIPPLTISSLDHHVRDAFTMHVLPLLLRRPDIRVDVKTRALRRTAFDLAVAVEGIVPERTPVQLDAFRHLETTAARSEVGATSAVHSSATTALMTNISARPQSLGLSSGTPGSARSAEEPREFPSSRLSYDEMSESINMNQNSSLMSTLGGALGGLLTRRKPSTGLSHAPVNGDAQSETTTPSVGLDGDALVSIASSEEEFEGTEPYHRVVSAPPGRIGVTFVEYRGHAMVSDVSATSPLQGWVYPSDILIAIDELAVSGMRIREIIQILKDRNMNQRALRVISLHTMNDAVLSTSALNETASEGIE